MVVRGCRKLHIAYGGIDKNLNISMRPLRLHPMEMECSGEKMEIETKKRKTVHVDGNDITPRLYLTDG